MRVGGVLLVWAVGCTPGASPVEVPVPSTTEFARVVYPILMADCGFSGCHGDAARFFSVFGPGRTRLSEHTPIYEPPTPRELAWSYDRARSMLIAHEGPRRSPLLRKPLAVRAGGSGHQGDDQWGAAIYSSKDHPNWVALFLWAARSQEAEP